MTFGSPFAELAAAIIALLTENETLRAQLAEQRQRVEALTTSLAERSKKTTSIIFLT
jgi:hypothetical protein